MIHIQNVSVFYDNKDKSNVLSNINFKAQNEDICAIIGPSGCGKTTLLKVLAGIIKNYEGEVFLKGEKLNPHIHKIGYIPQNFGLLPWKTVSENCLMSYLVRKKKITIDDIEVMNFMFKRLNISNIKDRYPIELSGGQKQRVAIVRSFLMNPDILLMDEAFSALDAIIREEAQELFLEIWNENRMVTFFVTHSIDEALYMGKKIIVMCDTPGKIIKVIDNKLFNNKDYKFTNDYSEEYGKIKNLIMKGCCNEIYQ